MSGPSYPATKPPYGRLHFDREQWKCWVEWEGKGIMTTSLAISVASNKDFGKVTLEIPLIYFEIVP